MRACVRARRVLGARTGQLYACTCTHAHTRAPPSRAPQVSSTQLRDDLLSMLVAGHETTGSALTWTLHLLVQNPEKMAKAQVRGVGEGGGARVRAGGVLRRVAGCVWRPAEARGCKCALHTSGLARPAGCAAPAHVGWRAQWHAPHARPQAEVDAVMQGRDQPTFADFMALRYVMRCVRGVVMVVTAMMLVHAGVGHHCAPSAAGACARACGCTLTRPCCCGAPWWTTCCRAGTTCRRARCARGRVGAQGVVRVGRARPGWEGGIRHAARQQARAHTDTDTRACARAPAGRDAGHLQHPPLARRVGQPRGV